MADDDEDIAALVVDNGSGMCKGALSYSEIKKDQGFLYD